LDSRPFFYIRKIGFLENTAIFSLLPRSSLAFAARIGEQRPTAIVDSPHALVGRRRRSALRKIGRRFFAKSARNRGVWSLRRFNQIAAHSRMRDQF